MSHSLPPIFLERFSRILSPALLPVVLPAFRDPALPVLRVNPLRWTVGEAEAFLSASGVSFAPLVPVPGAYLLREGAKEVLRGAGPVDEGRLYWQDASSLLPALVLGPRPGERVLDLCAAPGSKTTQMAALMKGEGEITAVEAVPSRFYRLRAVCSLLGAPGVRCLLKDGRRFRPDSRGYDRVLVDAPCSAEGRFREEDPESFSRWSPRKIQEMAHKQKGLLLNAGRCVAPAGVLLYATCTFAPEENEAVVDWFLRKTGHAFSLEPFDIPGVPWLPALAASLKGKAFAHDLSLCRRVQPDGVFTGFFMARFRRAENKEG